MAISKDAILLDNIKEALALYQRSLVWATTAALSGLLLAIRLREPTPDPVPVLSGTLSAPVAWAIAQALYLVFGALAFSAIRRYQLALTALNPSEEILQAIRLYPSLATLPGRFFRLGSVFVPPLATGASWTIELLREHSTAPPTRPELVDRNVFYCAHTAGTILGYSRFSQRIASAPYAAFSGRCGLTTHSTGLAMSKPFIFSIIDSLERESEAKGRVAWLSQEA
jgi:hypothetical protein